MVRIADGIEARAEEVALCECWDTGQAFKFMSKAALRRAENFRYFAYKVVQARDGQYLKGPLLMDMTTCANWTGGHYYALENTFYALDLKNCTSTRRGVHSRA